MLQCCYNFIKWCYSQVTFVLQTKYKIAFWFVLSVLWAEKMYYFCIRIVIRG